ncbi:MAG: hypothetical protein JNL01_12490 [Bdellovibrionales bacterium]|nr:hypothetical protein [Bdellovibrionales bacterium]
MKNLILLTASLVASSSAFAQSQYLSDPGRFSIGAAHQMYNFKSGPNNHTVNLKFDGAILERPRNSDDEAVVQYLPFAFSMNIPIQNGDDVNAKKDAWMQELKVSLARVYTEADWGESSLHLDASALGYEQTGIPAVGKTWRLTNLKIVDVDVQFETEVGKDIVVFVRGKASVGAQYMANRKEFDAAMSDNPHYDGIFQKPVRVRPEFYAGLVIADGIRVSLGYKPWNFRHGPEGSGFDYDSEQIKVVYQGLEAEVSMNVGDLFKNDGWRGLTVYGRYNHTMFRVRYTQDHSEMDRYTKEMVDTSVNQFEVGVRYKFNTRKRR